jgi:cell shape-determining protein MreD
VKVLWTGAALLLALLVESALSQLAPGPARLLDPFLLVLVFCGLRGGETHGMLAGLVGGWIQDVHFGGAVVGLGGLTKLLVGFGVGLAGARFVITGPAAVMAVFFGATLADALLFERLARLFDVTLGELTITGLLARAAVNGAIGAVLFEAASRRLREGAGG